MKSLLLLAALCTATAAAQTPSPLPTQDTTQDPGNYQPNCEHGSQKNACEQETATFSKTITPAGHEHRTLVFQDLKTYGPSINFGNSGGWTITHVVEAPHVVFGTSGIDQYLGANITKNGTGDLAGIYLYVFGGGRAAQSDEGVTGMTVASGEISGYFHGTIASGGAKGATALVLANNPAAQQNWSSTCDGCMLLDISKGTIAGNLNGKFIPLPGSYLNQLPTANVSVNGVPSKLPLTTAWCATIAAIPATATAGTGTSRTVNCKLAKIGGKTPAFRAGQMATVAGRGYPEQVLISQAGQPSGGVQPLTFAARNPNPAGSLIFQGGIAGQSLSFDDNLALTGFRTSYYVFGSLDGVNLIYGSQIAGDVSTNHVLPRPGSDAETTTSGFHLYPSAEIVANTADPSSPLLEPNAVAWENGDTVENPRFQSFGGVGLRDGCYVYTPSDEGNSASCLTVTTAGPGIAGTYHPFRIVNYNKPSLYTVGGGKLSPVTAVSVEGIFADLLSFRSGPSPGIFGWNSVIVVGRTAAEDNSPFNLFVLPSAHAQATTRVTYDPASHLVGFPQGIVAATIATQQDCASAAPHPNCAYASAGSIAIPAGATSVVVDSRLTAASEILVTPDTSLGAKLGIECNQNLATAFAPYGITARNPGHSFTLSIATPANAPNCYSFAIVN